MFWLIPFTLLLTFELIADIFAKEYSLKSHWYLWVVALSAYIVGNIFWLWSIKSGAGLARGSVIFSVVSALLSVAIGIYFYNESASKIQLVGMILGTISLGLIFWEA